MSNIQKLKSVLNTQKLAVLATLEKDVLKPYTSLVGFVVTEDARNLIFATTRATRKFNNIVDNPSVSFLIDSRSNDTGDFKSAVAVTVIGKASETGQPEKELFLDLFLRRHPHLEDFVNSPDCAVVRVEVEKYYFVSNFQDVEEIDPR